MTFTKEQLIERARENVKSLKFASTQHAFEKAFPAIEIDIRLAEIALASLEAEPDYMRYDCGCCGWETIEDWRENDVCPKCNHHPMGKTPLYAAPPAPVSDYPETLPCPVMLEPGLTLGKGVPAKILLEALQRRANYSAEIEVINEVCRDIKDGDFLAAAKINSSSELVNTAYKLPKPIKDHRLNSGPDADDYYAGYQAGWNDSIEEAEVVERPAYDIESFGIFSATEGESGLLLQIDQFSFGTEKCPQIGKDNMVPKFALQAIINGLQDHCDGMKSTPLIDILSTPAGAKQGPKE